ncbi:MAG: ferritin-like domain-containing protein [Pirellulales bacterium]|nr:ferritin-like domain-containing protein [Pirellulales bacterium]
MKKLNTFDDLFLHELKDIYSAEKQLLKALPKMAKAADNEKLREAFAHHLEETQGQVERLDQIASELELRLSGHTCVGMQGLLEEGAELMKMDVEPDLLDAALISAAQRVEHYEIAAYGVARTFATLLGHENVASLLDESLQEEGATDKLLTELAESIINVEALTEEAEG